MFHKNDGYSKLTLSLAIVAAVVCGIVGSGFYRSLSAGDMRTDDGLKIFAEVVELIERNYVDPVETKDLIQKAIQGMVGSLDPHSQLMPPEAVEELRIDTQGEFGGIGIVITMEKELLTVIAPIEGTPAQKAGVEAGDIIIEVDGETTKDLMLWEAVKKMRGPKGEPVVITVFREGEPDPIEFTLVRDIIPIDSVKHMALQPGYGYIRITNFQESTTDDLQKALADLKKDGDLKGLVLDLRDNPGGLLDQAVEVSDTFLQEGDIVSIKGRQERHTKVYKAHPDQDDNRFPIVVLINGGSASASEIVSGALQDHKRAVILGTTSFGKGSVQTWETLRDGYGLKYTIARYYTPEGRSIQAQGIVPDILVKHRYMEEAEESDMEMLKEKDLRNHLETLPVLEDEADSKASESPGKKSGQKSKQRRRSENQYGPLSKENLQTDHQVMRALEILKGYHIFAAARG
ncbi:MAG: S41 family peptidase [Desulfococcaceae bacterium]